MAVRSPARGRKIAGDEVEAVVRRGRCDDVGGAFGGYLRIGDDARDQGTARRRVQIPESRLANVGDEREASRPSDGKPSSAGHEVASGDPSLRPPCGGCRGARMMLVAIRGDDDGVRRVRITRDQRKTHGVLATMQCRHAPAARPLAERRTAVATAGARDRRGPRDEARRHSPLPPALRRERRSHLRARVRH